MTGGGPNHHLCFGHTRPLQWPTAGEPVIILVIDNYDSFTYNLVQYLGELGEEIEVRRNDEVTVEEVEARCCPDKILISPGPGRPEDAGVTMKMIEQFAGRVPILGVCLGHQAIGQAFA